MPATIPQLLDKRAVGKAVGDELLKRHGKKREYAFLEVFDVVEALALGHDAVSWALSLYSSAADFHAYHATLGQVHDYGAMKAEMFEAMTESPTIGDWFDVDMSWLDWPDFDFSGLFDFFDFS